MVAFQTHNAEHEPRDPWSWPSPPDPGDLSRRIIQRRTELRLSIAQVAEPHPVLQPGERRNILQATSLQPWPQGDHDLIIRIVPDRITGRRLANQ